MTAKDADIVTDILTRVVDLVRAETGPAKLDTLTAEALIRHIGALEVPIRREWARQECYVAARPRRHEEAKAAALAEVQRTGRVAEASSRHGVSRATIYRLLAGR